MKNIMKEQIMNLFEIHKYIATDGLYLSGYKNYGEYIQWFSDGSIFVHGFFDKTHNYIGEFIKYRTDGRISQYKFYSEGGPQDLGFEIDDIDRLREEYPKGPWI